MAKSTKPKKSAKPSKAGTAPKPGTAARPDKPSKPSKGGRASTTRSRTLAALGIPGSAADPDRVADTPTVVPASGQTRRGATRDTEEVKEDAGVGTRFSDLLAFRRGDRLADVDPASHPGFAGGKADGKAALAECSARLGDLQERLYAESRGGGSRSVLLVIQGMDTAGKGGIVEHVVGAVGPQGVKITGFKAPTTEERAHDFLWRITNALPGPGYIGVFDRSHYEDVLIVRVHDLVPPEQWRRRYAEINAWERRVAAAGTRIVKVMLHLSKDEQQARLQARLDDPTKHWKYNPGDVDERGFWDDYQAAYQVALSRCSTTVAPWHVVPADSKWYARLAVQQLLLEALTDMAPVWPAATFDVGVEKARLAES